MPFIAVVITYLVLRWKGGADFLHKDEWFFRWCDYLARLPLLAGKPLAVLILSLLGPVVVLLLILAMVNDSWLLHLLVAVLVLLFSVGRGRFRRHVKRYQEACEEGDWLVALAAYQATVPPRDLAEDLPEQGDWQGLDEQMKLVMAYRGLERTFAPLFWFVILGPAGALLYRLTAVYRQQAGEGEAQRLLWYLEWPPSRVLGLSFALTGNFVSCMHSLRSYFWRGDEATGESLLHFMRGALQAGEGALPAEAAQLEPQAMLALLSRTLIFWISALAIITVMV